ncbi:MAG: DegV family protein [Xanthomonadales bacterium]|nr:DegV family protein [Xanthomonadales bacterium]
MNTRAPGPPAAPPDVQAVDGVRLAEVLVAGIRHLFRRRDYINKINVFPVPDSDTGTNMAFTFKSMLEVIERRRDWPLPELVGALGEAALDGARGNSGAIMAQYFQGFREAVGERLHLDSQALAAACARGAEQAWTAMSEPVAGTLPTVLEDHARALRDAAARSTAGIRDTFSAGLEGAQRSLANTPNQLPVLKQAGVVDAGGQGFVDLLEGISAFIRDGVIDDLDAEWKQLVADDGVDPHEGLDVGSHQFCTECVIEGDGLDRQAVMERLQQLDQSSLVVAGSERRVRVHVHVNNPAEVFLACEDFGEITQQKADDMRWQHGLLNHPGRVAVVTDSGSDLPPAEAERLGLHIVPLRLSFGDREYLDGVTLDTPTFLEMLKATDEVPRTSQPPAKDFRRVFELLGTHGYEVLYLGISQHLSGTFQAGKSAAERSADTDVLALDTLNASCGQGLLALLAAELAAEDRSREEIVRVIEGLIPHTRVMAMPDELDSAVRGGRVPAWVGKLARFLRITPVLTAREGRMGLDGAHWGHGVNPERFARRVIKAMAPEKTYRVLIAHAGNERGARSMRRRILEGHGKVHSCHITDAGPALGVHMGVGGLVVGFLPEPQREDAPAAQPAEVVAHA